MQGACVGLSVSSRSKHWSIQLSQMETGHASGTGPGEEGEGKGTGKITLSSDIQRERGTAVHSTKCRAQISNPGSYTRLLETWRTQAYQVKGYPREDLLKVFKNPGKSPRWRSCEVQHFPFPPGLLPKALDSHLWAHLLPYQSHESKVKVLYVLQGWEPKTLEFTWDQLWSSNSVRNKLCLLKYYVII